MIRDAAIKTLKLLSKNRHLADACVNVCIKISFLMPSITEKTTQNQTVGNADTKAKER